MLGNSLFFNRTIRNITTGFGSLFASIVIARYNYATTPWTEQQRFLVKLVEGEKEKYIQALEGDPTNTKKVQITLPMMAYNFLGLKYDATRKGQTTLQNYNPTGNGGVNTQYAPVPYNLHFQLYIYVRNKIDGEQIVEQILPFFTPDYTLTISTVPAMNITQAVPITLNSATYEMQNDGNNQTDTRYILWTLDFTAMGNIYGPTTAAGYIQEAITDIYDWNETDGTSLTLLLNTNTGHGTYLPGEIVYQGTAQQYANATAYVTQWTNTTSQLQITNAQGLFYTNQPLTGSLSGAVYNILNYEITPQILENITVTANTSNGNNGSGVIYNVEQTFYDTAI